MEETKQKGCGRYEITRPQPIGQKSIQTSEVSKDFGSLSIDLRLARLTLGHFLKVILDDLAIARRHVASQLGHGLGPFFLRQLAPLLSVVRQPFLVNVARSAKRSDLAILHRITRI